MYPLDKTWSISAELHFVSLLLFTLNSSDFFDSIYIINASSNRLEKKLIKTLVKVNEFSSVFRRSDLNNSSSRVEQLDPVTQDINV